MKEMPTLEQQLAAVDAQLRSNLYPDAELPVRNAPFVTLSRETGAGAATVGRMLVNALNSMPRGESPPWVFFDKNLLSRALEHQQLPSRLAAFLPEDEVHEIRSAIGELVGLHPSLWDINAKVAESILRFAHCGHVVLAGRGATWITKGRRGGLHVRLVGSLERRAARISCKLRISHEEALDYCRTLDAARKRFVRSHFDQDPDDPHHYDLIFNTDHLALRAVARTIACVLAKCH